MSHSSLDQSFSKLKSSSKLGGESNTSGTLGSGGKSKGGSARDSSGGSASPVGGGRGRRGDADGGDTGNDEDMLMISLIRSRLLFPDKPEPNVYVGILGAGGWSIGDFIRWASTQLSV